MTIENGYIFGIEDGLEGIKTQGRVIEPAPFLAKWNLDEGEGTVAADSSILGQGFDGVLDPSAEWVEKDGQNCVYMPGSDRVVFGSNLTRITLDGGDNWEMSGWVWGTSVGGPQMLFSRSPGTNSFPAGSSQCWLDVVSGAISYNTVLGTIISSKNVINARDNSWHYWGVACYEGVLHLYMDGIIQGSSAFAFVDDPTLQFQMGRAVIFAYADSWLHSVRYRQLY